MNQAVKYHTRSEIDTKRWDACVEASPNGEVYALSWYLDHVSPRWGGLVEGDYDRIMGWGEGSKWGIRYVYNPPFAPNLGVMGAGISPEWPVKADIWLSGIPRRFLWRDLQLNYSNVLADDRQRGLQRRFNQLLDLSKPYPELEQAYRDSYRPLIRAATRKFEIRYDVEAERIIRLAQSTKQYEGNYSGQAFNRLSSLCAYIQAHPERAVTLETVSVMRDDEILASGLFLLWRQKAYYLLAGNSPEGRRDGASHAMLNAFIRLHAGEPRVLDFEGSDMEGIAFFFRGFGGRDVRYWRIRGV